MFWGIIFLVVGVALILKVIFKLDIPVFRLIIAVVFIYFGLRILFGDSFSFNKTVVQENSAVFGESYYDSTDQPGKNEYNAVFGKLNLDLRNQEFTAKETHIVINAVFGGAEIRLPANIPVKIKSDVVFGGAKLPDGNSGGFGSYRYKSDDFDENTKHIFIEIHAVFGGVDIFR